VPEGGKERRGVTLRGFLLGAVMALGVGLFAAYAEMMIRASPMANDYTAPVALFFVFFIIVLFNLPMRLIKRRWMLTTGELATVYVMMLAAAAVPTRGFVEFLGPVVTGAQYYASPQNHWGEMIVPHVVRQTWIVPQGEDVLRWYYEGVPKGQGIPWEAWIGPVGGWLAGGFVKGLPDVKGVPLIVWFGPVGAWLAFCMALCFVMMCVAVIFRRQWMDNERLVFPLAQAPMQLARESGPDAAGSQDGTRSIWRSRLLWLGFAVPLVLFSWKALHYYFPAFVPNMQNQYYLRIWRQSGSIRFRISPICLGLLYFVRRDILMGLWVFPLIVTVGYGYLRMIGLAPMQPKLGIWSYDTIRAFTGAGVILVYVGHFIYVSRGHLRQVLLRAWRNDRGADDTGEIMSYRTAVLGIALAGFFMAGWLHKSGMDWWQAGLYLALAFTIYLGLTRVIAEAGLPTAQPPMVAGDFMVATVGSRAFSPQNLVGVGFTYPYHAEMRTFLMAACANGLKVAHEALHGRRRLLMWGIMVAVLLSFVGSMFLMIYFPYSRGALNLDRFTFHNGAVYSWRDAASRMQEPRGPIWKAFPLMFGGAAFMALLLFAMHYFPSWPLHPAGLVISFQWTGFVLWFPAFVIWVVKGLILKWGGPRVYRMGRPLFLGFIIGEIMTAGLWIVVDILTGEQFHYLTSFF